MINLEEVIETNKMIVIDIKDFLIDVKKVNN